MALKWSEQLSVGNDLIDADHKYLIEIVNQVEQGMRANDQSELTAALNSLVQYSKIHFPREEKIASAVGYKRVSNLHDSHEALIVKLGQIREEIEQGWTAASEEHFSTMLREWLINHIIKEDLLMKPLLTKFSPSFVSG